MKKSLRLFAIAGVALCTAGSFASSRDEQQIKAAYTKLEHALKTRNISAIEALEAPGFTDNAEGRTMTAQESNAQMKQQFSMMKSVDTFNIKVTSIRVNGRTAKGSTSFTMKGTLRVGKDPKVHTFKVVGTTTEDLVKTSKGWLFKHTSDTGSRSWMDGKEIKM